MTSQAIYTKPYLPRTKDLVACQSELVSLIDMVITPKNYAHSMEPKMSRQHLSSILLAKRTYLYSEWVFLLWNAFPKHRGCN